jgi:hypothetical protein
VIRRRSATIAQDQLIWIFGHGRSGSSWLARMMTEPDGFAAWNEPQVGEMLGSFYYLRYPHRRNRTFLLGDKHRDVWEEGIRFLVLGGAQARYPKARWIVVKEPHGSIGAPLLSRALPESRVVLLLRDPRDMVASALDGQRAGSWATKNAKRRGGGAVPLANRNPDAFVASRAKTLAEHVKRATEAHDGHSGPKARLRYEELRREPLPTLRRLFEELDLPVTEEELSRSVETHRWEAIPRAEKGEGRIFRKAAPGAWRDDLTADQARTVERITAPVLGEYFS